MLKNLLERGMWLCLYTNALPLTSRGISLDERPTVIQTVTFIGIGFKNPTNSGFADADEIGRG